MPARNLQGGAFSKHGFSVSNDDSSGPSIGYFEIQKQGRQFTILQLEPTGASEYEANGLLFAGSTEQGSWVFERSPVDRHVSRVTIINGPISRDEFNEKGGAVGAILSVAQRAVDEQVSMGASILGFDQLIRSKTLTRWRDWLEIKSTIKSGNVVEIKAVGKQHKSGEAYDVHYRIQFQTRGDREIPTETEITAIYNGEVFRKYSYRLLAEKKLVDSFYDYWQTERTPLTKLVYYYPDSKTTTFIDEVGLEKVIKRDNASDEIRQFRKQVVRGVLLAGTICFFVIFPRAYVRGL